MTSYLKVTINHFKVRVCHHGTMSRTFVVNFTYERIVKSGGGVEERKVKGSEEGAGVSL
jgi:hypothetical protein